MDYTDSRKNGQRTNRRHPEACYSESGLFRGVAVANHPFREWPPQAYPQSRLNAYYRSILEMAERGWPRGLRWLHGEDEIPETGQAS